ncbi:hypothetical protein SAMN05443432_106109 [Roseovarius litoreus]|uniref:Phage repressor protein C, contains Cro/C1-type HTH and peptisase s24 domains n=1 Tax=Roseovarius litoreus TaxID=1155722 RepID=A0A1M7HSL5_9RHOB|nr:hypothetical protein [Roseovarius litoreus]SHM31117.1 hypothetical protein SAMN05443432_106109 [Roseovarius litoreus]
MTQFSFDILRDGINEGIARHGLRGYARKLGIDLNMLRSIRDGRDIQTSKLVEVLDAMGLRLTLHDNGAEPRNAAQPGFGEPGGGAEGPKPGFLPIPFHPSERRYGQTAPIGLAREWLEMRGLTPEKLSFVIAPDDRLSPLVVEGALCLVDGGQRKVTGHAIRAYLRNGQLGMSYVSQPEPGLMVLSGLKRSEPPCVVRGPALDALTILGTVVWRGADTEADSGTNTGVRAPAPEE